ncbi:MAG: TetR/AcrR family transcriptional regulator [Syntrophales bacterium]|nr:TetR/AcrR family transcriptional regulator [Syntrophales bacterium]
MAQRRRSQLDVKERQMNIVKKAARLFFKKGYAQTTMRDIARATKINLGNLYNYIESKEDILCHIFYMYHEPFAEWIEKEKIMEIEDPRVQLEKSVEKVVEMINNYRKEVLLMYRETRVLPPKFMKRVLATEGSVVSFFEGILKRGMDQGVFKIKDPFFSANMLVFQMSLYALRSWNLKRYSQEEIKKLMVESIMASVLP